MSNHIQDYKTAATAKNQDDKDTAILTLDLINNTNHAYTYKNPKMPLLPLLEPTKEVNYQDLQLEFYASNL